MGADPPSTKKDTLNLTSSPNAFVFPLRSPQGPDALQFDDQVFFNDSDDLHGSATSTGPATAVFSRLQPVEMPDEEHDSVAQLADDFTRTVDIAPKADAFSTTGKSRMSAAKRASVQNFVNEQAHTQTIEDPNRGSLVAPAPVKLSPPEDVSTPPLDESGRESSTGSGTPVLLPETPSPGPERPPQHNPAEPEIATVRFEHVETPAGHHVLTGKEGEIKRCEDEPIRTPGAVQGFGVLMVLEEHENGTLTVRQVSENSTDLLGLSPQFLFGLECFTYLLDEDQEDTLRDIIASLFEDPDDASVQGPQVFRLSGACECTNSVRSGCDHRSRRSHGTRCSAANKSRTTPSTSGRSSSSLPSLSESDLTDMRTWSCWVAASRPDKPFWNRVDPTTGIPIPPPNITILEFELEDDTYNPLHSHEEALAEAWRDDGPSSDDTRSQVGLSQIASSLGTHNTSMWSSVTSVTQPTSVSTSSRMGLDGDENYSPSLEQIPESTTSYSKPLRALRSRGMSDGSGVLGGRRPSMRKLDPNRRHSSRRNGNGPVDVFAVLNEINEQLTAAPDLDKFLKIAVGVIREVSRFHRVLVYEFDEEMNGKVVTELADLNWTNDLYNGLMFPAADIPPQARQLYMTNKVRFLYDRSQTTARLVLREKIDIDYPLDMSQCFLRAMSPIHLKYLENMAVRSSMSISIVAFGKLWGLIACHSYGTRGMRVSFPVRQMFRILSDQISRNVERLEYARRLQSRKIMHSSGLAALASFEGRQANPNKAKIANKTLLSNADDMLSIFDAFSGLLVIRDRCKLIGQNRSPRVMLSIAEYFRRAKYDHIRASSQISVDFPDLPLTQAMDDIAGLLYVPLTADEPGNDFIVFFRKGQLHTIKWAGKPYRDGDNQLKPTLEPRTSFKLWKETVRGKAAEWTEEQFESAEVLSVLYNKFIPAWRERRHMMESNQLTALLLSNTSHQLRTPLGQIINTLELAMAGNVDVETRTMLENSHEASRALLFHVHDLLELTGVESGVETAFHDPFNLKETLVETVRLYQTEAHRRGLRFELDCGNIPSIMVGDQRKTRTVVSNLVANAVQYTTKGGVRVECRVTPSSLPVRAPANDESAVDVEIIIRDTGCGIPPDKLEAIFIALEGHDDNANKESSAVGLGLAAVGRVVEQLNGQLRAESEVGKQTTFYVHLPMGMTDLQILEPETVKVPEPPAVLPSVPPALGTQSTKLEPKGNGVNPLTSAPATPAATPAVPAAAAALSGKKILTTARKAAAKPPGVPMRILLVEDDVINSKIIKKQFKKDGHQVIAVENGQEAVDLIRKDQGFDLIVMDMQMPVLDGWGAAAGIRQLEAEVEPAPAVGERAAFRLDHRIPIVALSASLYEEDRERLSVDFDGWLLKPLNFARGRLLMDAIRDATGEKRDQEVYQAGCWERGGFFQGHSP